MSHGHSAVPFHSEPIICAATAAGLTALSGVVGHRECIRTKIFRCHQRTLGSCRTDVFRFHFTFNQAAMPLAAIKKGALG
jgi:hypothetical protein